jgi:hypothetical protein
MAEFHLREADQFKAALGKLCLEERRLRSNAAAPSPKLEGDFRAAALGFVAAYRATLAAAVNIEAREVTR